MNTRAPCRRARQTLFAIRQIRFSSTTAEASTEAVVKRKNYKEDKPNYKTYGSKIWVYTHLQKHHMVYSLTKSMRNNPSLRQLPFNGKKTVPPALRKDLWHPFCNITFHPNTSLTTSTASAIGLSCYQKLREFRRRHELEWEQSDYMDATGTKFVGREKIPLLLCDQKANSVADMAYVFERLGRSNVDKKEEENIGLIGGRTGSTVRIEWWDLRDAEFAETWSDNVEHVAMEELQTNNRIEGKLWGKGKQRVEEREAKDRARARGEAAEEETMTV